jgi:hypothetical protein
MQADMWDSSAPPSEPSAFAPFKAQMADRAARFGRPVRLLEGDSHILKVDRPAGMPPNLTRVVMQGSTNTPHEWLRLHVQPRTSRVFSCESVVFGSGATTACPKASSLELNTFRVALPLAPAVPDRGTDQATRHAAPAQVPTLADFSERRSLNS